MLDMSRRWSIARRLAPGAPHREVRNSSLLVSELVGEIPAFKAFTSRLERLGFTLASCGVQINEVTDTDIESETAKVRTFYTLQGPISFRRGGSLLHACVVTTGAPKKAYASVQTLLPHAQVRQTAITTTKSPVPPGKGRKDACRVRAREIFEANCEALTPGMAILVPYLSNRIGKSGRMKISTARFKVEDFVPAWQTPPRTEADTLRESRRLFWNELHRIPIDRKGRIKESFRHFPRWTELQVIHRWFEDVFRISVNDLKQTTGAKT